MERELANHLLLIAEAYASAKGLKLSTLGRLSAWDGRFFDNLRDPTKSFTARKYDEVLAYFSAHWPAEGLDWPEQVAKPDQGEWARVVARIAARAASKRSAPTEPARASA